MPDRRVTIDPHHPDCRLGDHDGWWASADLDPERCCYCAAVARGEPEGRRLDYRYGGPGCACKPTHVLSERGEFLRRWHAGETGLR